MITHDYKEMLEAIQVIAVIAGIIQLVLIFLFIQMASDVSQIRSKMASKNTQLWHEEYTKNSYLGRDKEALYSLQEYVWLSFSKGFNKRRKYDDLKSQYQERFIELGSKFPEFPY